MAYVVERPNDRDEQIAAKGLSTPPGADARLLHRLVRRPLKQLAVVPPDDRSTAQRISTQWDDKACLVAD